jgi:hypothetical protein
MRNPDCASLPRKTPTTLPAIGNDSSTIAGAPLLHPSPATMRTMTQHTLGTAAQACGLNKSTVLRAIKAGKVSATRDEHGQWQIDPAELHRVYPPVASNAAKQRSEQRYTPPQHRDRTDELVAQLREQLSDMRNERDRARSDADTWRVAFEHERAQCALPVPGNVAQAPGTPPATPATPAEQPSRLRRAWRWMRTTG